MRHVPHRGEADGEVDHGIGRTQGRRRAVTHPRPHSGGARYRLPVDPVDHHVPPLDPVGQDGAAARGSVVEHPVGPGVVGRYVHVTRADPVVVTVQDHVPRVRFVQRASAAVDVRPHEVIRAAAQHAVLRALAVTAQAGAGEQVRVTVPGEHSRSLYACTGDEHGVTLERGPLGVHRHRVNPLEVAHEHYRADLGEHDLRIHGIEDLAAVLAVAHDRPGIVGPGPLEARRTSATDTRRDATGGVVHDRARVGHVDVRRPQERPRRGPRREGAERIAHVLPLDQVERAEMRDHPVAGTVGPVVGGRVHVIRAIRAAQHGRVRGDRRDRGIGRRRGRGSGSGGSGGSGCGSGDDHDGEGGSPDTAGTGARRHDCEDSAPHQGM